MRLVALLLVVGCTASADPSPDRGRGQGPKPGPSSAPKPMPAGGPTEPPHCKGGAPDCAAFGYKGGTTRCTPEGEIDLSACAGTASVFGDPQLPGSGKCGNGKLDVVKERVCAPCVADSTSCPCADVERKVEECDGAALDGQTCARLGFVGGTLACDRRCRFDLAGCAAVAHGVSSLQVGSLAGLDESFSFPDALGAMRGMVAAAWTMQRRGMERDIVLAWTDPALRVLRAAPRFDGGNVAEMRLSGHERGWLLAVSRFADNPGPNPAHVVVYPVSTHGHVGKPGAAVARPGLLFLQRGAPGEPSLVGAQSGAMQGSQPTWTIDGWFVDDAGEPKGKPFQIGTATPGYSKLAARVAYQGGKFFVVRGTTRDPPLDVSIIARDGTVKTLPTAHADFTGTPVGLLVSHDRIAVAYVQGRRSPETWLASFAHDGKLLEPPRVVSPEAGAALLGPIGAPALLTTAGKLQVATGAQQVLGGPGLFLPAVAETADGTFALAITRHSAAIAKLR